MQNASVKGALPIQQQLKHVYALWICLQRALLCLHYLYRQCTLSLAEQARVSGTVGLYTSLQNVISESRLSNKVVELQERVVEHPFIITLCALPVTVGMHCLSFHACLNTL